MVQLNLKRFVLGTVIAFALMSTAWARTHDDPARPWILGKISEFKIDPMDRGPYDVAFVVRPNYNLNEVEKLARSLISQRETSRNGMWKKRTWTDGFGAIQAVDHIVPENYKPEFDRMGREIVFLRQDLESIAEIKRLAMQKSAEVRVAVTVGAAEGYDGVFALNKTDASEKLGIRSFRDLNIVKKGWLNTFASIQSIESAATTYDLFNVSIEVRHNGSVLLRGAPVATDLQTTTALNGLIGSLKAAIGSDRAEISLVQSHKTQLSQLENLYVEEMRKGTHLAGLLSGNSSNACRVVFTH